MILSLVGLVAAFFYFPVTMMREGEHNGQILGQADPRDSRGARQRSDRHFGYALLREVVVRFLLFQVVGGLLFGIPWLVDVLWPLWDDENRCLHDMIVKSHVVRA